MSIMDNVNHERKLQQILERVNKEISDDVLEKIVSAQRRFKCRDKDTQNVGTMTEELQSGVSTACVINTINNVEKSTAAEKQATKKRNAEERKANQLANKIYKPGECMKHMTVELHPVLSAAWYAADVSRELAAAGGKLREAAALCCPALLLWTRGVAPGLSADGGVLELAPTQIKCDRALYIATADEISEFVASKNLSQKMDNMAQLTGCKMTLVVFGVEDYFKPSGRKRNNVQRQQMTEVELEMAITDLLVTANCDTVKVETPNELALTVVHFTKAIAEAPHKQAKRQCDEQAQFYMRGDNKNCVAVNKNGAGLSKLWQQMLAVLPMSSLERSRALCARYNSPKRLYEELHTPSGVATIADIGVARSAVPGSVARRTGTEFARKLAILFTSDDGDVLVQ
ncbi:crossover junction endonuclease EME1 [Epargyreus clarus]|uniref:crossover junction endonuclease EME1 n=1 Tax=Epargyreus clarus TaxID=520877 RepID=UPI003C2FE84C